MLSTSQTKRFFKLEYLKKLMMHKVYFLHILDIHENYSLIMYLLWVYSGMLFGHAESAVK